MPLPPLRRRATRAAVTFIAEASLHIPVSPEVAFDTLADHGSWAEWMPRTFMPVGRSPGALTAGARILVKIAYGPLPSPIMVSVVERPREIAWRGGLPGLVAADHRFLFESDGKGGTVVRSVESWTGVLAWAMKPLLARLAEGIGAQQLAGLAKGATRKAPRTRG